MTVKELIEQLQQFNPDLTVIYQTTEDNYEPTPHLRKFNFRTSYYTGNEFITIEKNQEYVML